VSHERQSNVELDPELVKVYTAAFISRHDMYPIQLEDGRYATVRKRLNLETVVAHLQGALTLGAYALDRSNRAKWVCFDADNAEGWHRLLRMAESLSDRAVTPYIELSRRGGHLWLFLPLNLRLSGVDARRAGHQLIADYNLEKIEFFPKQDLLTTGPGSLVRLPLGYHRKTGRRYHFVTLEGTPIAPTIREQIRVLAHPERVPHEFINSLLERAPKSKTFVTTPNLNPSGKGKGEMLSARLKDRITVYQFVGQYVSLDEQGKGFCPFHDDQHKSLGVDKEGNFWHCFAGCGGGSIIDFWMKWREKQGKTPGFTATITDLAEMLF
jgi:hypothetical protein